MKRISSLFWRWSPFSLFVLIAAVMVVAYYQVVNFYFWADDWDLLFKVVHPEEPNLWNLGPGPFGVGRYRFLHTPFLLLYPLFRLRAEWYFGISIVLYFLAVFAFYLFVQTVSGKRSIAAIAAFLFAASGYIGSYTISHISNSYQMFTTVFLTSFTLWLLATWYKTKNIRWYFLSVLLFTFTLETMFVRAHGFIILIGGLTLLFAPKRKIVSFVPFLFVFLLLYGFTDRVQSSGLFRQQYVLYPFGTLANALVPEVLTRQISGLRMSAGITIFFAFLFAAGNMLRRKKIAEAKLIVFGLLYFFGQYAGYFLVNPESGFLSTTHRYLTPALPGIYLALAAVLSSLRIRKVPIGVLITLAYAGYLVLLMNQEAQFIVERYSKPTKRFYETIRAAVPKVAKDTLLLLDMAHDGVVSDRLRSSYPDTAIALFYGLPDKSTRVALSFSDLLRLVKERSASPNAVFSFYTDGVTTIETTPTVRSRLQTITSPTRISPDAWTSREAEITSQEDGTAVRLPTTEASFSYPSVVPMEVTLTLSLRPLSLDTMKFPVAADSDGLPERIADVACQKRQDILTIERNRRTFYQSAIVTAASSWSTDVAGNLVDGNAGTKWMGREIVMDLGYAQPVNRLFWVNAFPSMTPTEYRLFTSFDQKNWEKIAEVRNGPRRESEELVVEHFSSRQARYMKMEITGAFAGDPAVAEVWADEGKGAQVNYKEIEAIHRCPMCCPVATREEAAAITSFVSDMGSARLWWLANNDTEFRPGALKEFPIMLDGRPHTYTFLLPAGGTKLEKLRIDGFQVPVSVIIHEARIRSLSLNELLARAL